MHCHFYCSCYCTCHCRGPPQALRQQSTRQGVFMAVNVCPLWSWWWMVVLANGEVLSIVIVPPYSGVNGRVQKRHKASDSIQNYFVCPFSSPLHVCKVWRHSDAPLRRADLPKTAPWRLSRGGQTGTGRASPRKNQCTCLGNVRT